MANYPYYQNYNQMPTYQPQYQPQQFAARQPLQLIRVTGIEGAKAYDMPPNSAAPLFDSNNDIMYIKTTDDAGFPTIRAFSFTALDMAPAQNEEFVTRQEFETRMGQIVPMFEEIKGLLNAEQPVPEKSK